MELTLSSSNAIRLPGAMSWSVSGTGLCVDTHGILSLGTGSLSGTLNSLAGVGADCALGALLGDLTFDPPSTGAVWSSVAGAVHVGAVLVVVMLREASPRLAGTGVFVLDPVKTTQTTNGVLACATASSNVTLHFRGTFAFAEL